jgi:hypothetical protein
LGLHRTLGRELGHSLVHRLHRLRKLELEYEREHRPFQPPDHRLNRFALAALCEELHATEEVLDQTTSLVKHMVGYGLYPELNLEPQLRYLTQLRLVLENTCRTLNCCQQFYDQPPQETYHPEQLRDRINPHLPLPHPLRGRHPFRGHRPVKGHPVS